MAPAEGFREKLPVLMSRQGLPSRETSSGGELASGAQLAGECVGQGRGGRRHGAATGLVHGPRYPEMSDYQEDHLAATHSPSLDSFELRFLMSSSKKPPSLDTVTPEWLFILPLRTSKMLILLGY